MAKNKTKNNKKTLFNLDLKDKKVFGVFVGVVAAIGLAFVGLTSASDNYTLFWSDEFNGSSLNTDIWTPYNSTYGDGNNEEACLTPNNVAVSGGSLKISAKKERKTCPNGKTRDFTSGFIGSREKNNYFPKHAKYEIKAKVPHAQGMWPAFWLRHKNGSSIAEIDVMEYFHSQVPGKTTQTIHLDKTYNIAKKTTFIENSTNSPGWHIWGVEMRPDPNDSSKTQIIFTTDGVETLRVTPSQQNWTNAVNEDAMFDMAINLAVGGNYVGHPDDELGWSRYLSKCLKPYNGSRPCNGSGIDRASYPEVYEVDYVRVYTKGGPEEPAPEPEVPTPEEPVGDIPVPSNFRASNGDESVTLRWALSSDSRVDEYSPRYIRSDSKEKSNGSKWTYPGRTDNNQYTVSELEPGVDYDFQVRAIDNKGTSSSGDDEKSSYTSSKKAKINESEPQPEPEPVVEPPVVTPPEPTDSTAPSAPRNLRRSISFSWSGKCNINLAWDASTDNNGVAGYKVERQGLDKEVTTTQLSDSAVSPRRTYNYAVSAYDAAGNLSQPASISVRYNQFLWWCWFE